MSVVWVGEWERVWCGQVHVWVGVDMDNFVEKVTTSFATLSVSVVWCGWVSGSVCGVG